MEARALRGESLFHEADPFVCEEPAPWEVPHVKVAWDDAPITPDTKRIKESF